MARELHQAGVATDTLEETLGDIASAIGLTTQIFALPTQITIAFGPSWNQKIVLMRLPPGRVNLRKLSLLNGIYDELRAGKIDYREASVAVQNIDRRWPGRNSAWEIPALTLLAVGVAILLGGGTREMIVAGCIGFATGIISAVAERVPIVARLFEAIAAFVATLIVAAFSNYFGPTNIFISIVAGVVVLLPGYSLTLALHELANSDLVSGMARLGRVLSVLLELGCGAFLGFAVIGPSLLKTGDVTPHAVPTHLWIIAAILMTVGISIDLDSRPRDFIWVFASCFVALLTSHLLGGTPVHEISAFISAFLCGIVANAGARVLRLPQPLMLVPALLVLVPGSLSYESVLFAFQHNISSALTFAVNASFAAVQLVAGLLLSQLVFPAKALQVHRAGRPR
ncbi:MAG TPA: threonine/serine exporter family protein [Candidatus Baltobacteraceae bacterium]|nr:threonine/serine exporter family protein [Candidatus Baltobacteraceae bacterium]